MTDNPALQQRRFPEFLVNHRKNADETTIELLSAIQDVVNLAIKEGCERIELRYLNTPDDIDNRYADIGKVRVTAFRTKEGGAQ